MQYYCLHCVSPMPVDRQPAATRIDFTCPPCVLRCHLLIPSDISHPENTALPPCVEHAVVTHVAGAAVPEFGHIGEHVRRPVGRVFSGLPGRRKQHLARIVNTLKLVIIDHTRGVDVESEMTRQYIPVSSESCIRRRGDLGDRQRFGLSDLGSIQSLLNYLQVRGRMTVGSRFADAQVIIGEDAAAALPSLWPIQLSETCFERTSAPQLLWTVSWSAFDLSKAYASYLNHSSDTQTACALNRWLASPNGWQARRD